MNGIKTDVISCCIDYYGVEFFGSEQGCALDFVRDNNILTHTHEIMINKVQYYAHTLYLEGCVYLGYCDYMGTFDPTVPEDLGIFHYFELEEPGVIFCLEERHIFYNTYRRFRKDNAWCEMMSFCKFYKVDEIPSNIVQGHIHKQSGIYLETIVKKGKKMYNIFYEGEI